MIKTFFFLSIFVLGITLNTIWIIPVLILRLLRLRTLDRRAGGFINAYQARLYLKMLGMKVEVNGLEHCRGLDGKALCVISNHQGLLDIPLVLGYIPLTCGFIAKRELAYLPMFYVQMWYLHCVLINRNSPRSAVRAIERGVKNIKKGYPMLIFPEGTRSRSSEMGEFKKGSLKLAIRSQSTILPITINGSFRGLEEYGVARSANVVMNIHQAIPTAGMERNELKDLHKKLEQIVRSGLNE